MPFPHPPRPKHDMQSHPIAVLDRTINRARSMARPQCSHFPVAKQLSYNPCNSQLLSDVPVRRRLAFHEAQGHLPLAQSLAWSASCIETCQRTTVQQYTQGHEICSSSGICRMTPRRLRVCKRFVEEYGPTRGSFVLLSIYSIDKSSLCCSEWVGKQRVFWRHNKTPLWIAPKELRQYRPISTADCGMSLLATSQVHLIGLDELTSHNRLRQM
jgi:hypothetical protein